MNLTSIQNRIAGLRGDKANIGGCVKPLRLVYNWLHQSYFYLDRTERIARTLCEGIGVAIMAYLLSRFTDMSLNSPWLFVISVATVHTLNWIFNNNWWACILFAFPGLRNPGAKVTCHYLNAFADRIQRNSSIVGVMVFGSLSRNQWHNRSDLDIRLLRRRGFWHGMCAVYATGRERVIAFFLHQPLDMYLADSIQFLDKMRDDEIPIFLVKTCPDLEKRYPGVAVRRLRVSDMEGRNQ